MARRTETISMDIILDTRVITSGEEMAKHIKAERLAGRYSNFGPKEAREGSTTFTAIHERDLRDLRPKDEETIPQETPEAEQETESVGQEVRIALVPAYTEPETDEVGQKRHLSLAPSAA